MCRSLGRCCLAGRGWGIVLVTSASGADGVAEGEPAPNSGRQARELADVDVPSRGTVFVGVTV